jgi:L-ascorbate metabolism protein UlaG (beta-lactamase superfamily)
MRKLVAWLLLVLAASGFPAGAETRPSDCLAIAQSGGARVQYAALKESEAQLTYVGHSTFILESPQGIRIATDYAGWAGGVVPDAATMNHAHSSHYTDAPDPAIKQVLRGWSENGEPARHNLTVGDVRIRNVTTDIRSNLAEREKDGNSIFIFEVAGLCIGHLGHLHHELTPEHIGAIGRLDVVMVPVDGGLTLPVENMMSVLKDIRARIVIPMHMVRQGSLDRFLGAVGGQFKVRFEQEPSLVVSTATLPAEPTVYILPAR